MSARFQSPLLSSASLTLTTHSSALQLTPPELFGQFHVDKVDYTTESKGGTFMPDFGPALELPSWRLSTLEELSHRPRQLRQIYTDVRCVILPVLAR